MSRNKYKHFQDRINAETIADGLVNNQFVFSAENSIVLRNAFRDEWQVQASVVNLQEKDMAYIYVRDDEDDLLPIGSVWGAKGLKWIITEEIVIFSAGSDFSSSSAIYKMIAFLVFALNI